eukprot:1194572-Prorocentrum_minimum.AAC.4
MSSSTNSSVSALQRAPTSVNSPSTASRIRATYGCEFAPYGRKLTDGGAEHEDTPAAVGEDAYARAVHVVAVALPLSGHPQRLPHLRV